MWNTDANGHLVLDNGWTVSIQQSDFHYSSDNTWEIWALKGEERYPEMGPEGWQTKDEVDAFIKEVSGLKN